MELSGVGFFVDLIVPADAPLADPPKVVGGDAELSLSGAKYGAGCCLFVDAGRLSLFEGFTYGDEEWNEHAALVSVGGITPIDPAGPPPGG